MSRKGIVWSGLTGVLALGTLFAEVPAGGENPYQVIIDRNPFGLQPPPVVATATNAAPAPPSNIQFSGVTVDKRIKKAWLIITVAGEKTARYLSISEGEKQDDIEVVRIDEKAGEVAIVQGSKPMTLTFASHGIKNVARAPAPVPGAPGAPGAVPVPGMTPPGGVPNAPTGGAVIIGRGGVTSNAGATGGGYAPPNAPFGNTAGATMNTTTYPAQAGMAAGGNLQVLPTRNVRTVVQPVPQAPQVDPEVQAILMRANKLEADSRGIPMPPLPPLPGEAPPLPGQP